MRKVSLSLEVYKAPLVHVTHFISIAISNEDQHSAETETIRFRQSNLKKCAHMSRCFKYYAACVRNTANPRR